MKHKKYQRRKKENMIKSAVLSKTFEKMSANNI